MKHSTAMALSGLLALARCSPTPPKQPFTPYFHLQVLHSSNSSLVGSYLYGPDYQAELSLTSNHSLATTWYQAGPNYTTSQHPLGGPVLVRNVTTAVPDNIPGTPYTDRNLIVGTTGCVSCDDSALPMVAAIFDKSQDEWDDFGGWQIDFHIDEFALEKKVHFNLTEGGGLSGWDKTSFCRFVDAGDDERYIVTVTERYYPEKECDEIHLGWKFADF